MQLSGDFLRQVPSHENKTNYFTMNYTAITTQEILGQAPKQIKGSKDETKGI
jgi:hypothetical protein